MTMSSRSSVPNVGRFTAVILGLVVIVCVTMIGGTGYLKYKLDRAESLLAAPDATVGSDQDLFDRLRRDLGYGGFLGLAQNYAFSHDVTGFAEMKAHIKAADEIVAHLPDKVTAEARHELVAIVHTFDFALQKIAAPASDTNGEFTAADLTPLYAALPILDARVASANGETRFEAQSQVQFWAMLLTLVSWCSLIIAAACAAGIYLTLRDKHSAPMRALAQSIQNMARGDMRTSIWGTERQDMIGELARSVDIARYHFSHLPDLSLLSEQGPVRMRFEGGSRSLFEAMMGAISRDSEHIREQSQALTQAMQAQKETLTQMSSKVEHVLANILQHGQSGDHQIKQAIQEMVGSAENLKNAHAHAADQLNRLIPHIQDRAQGMAEIAHITGKQIGQTLQSLAVSEAGLKINADQARETMTRLFSTADELGERLFGAINLLQASGKVLAETTQKLQSGGAPVFAPQSSDMSPFENASIEPLAHYLDDITQRLSMVQRTLDTEWVHPAASRQPMSSPVEGRPDPSLLSGITNLLASRIEPKLADLHRALALKGTSESAASQEALAALGRRVETLLQNVPATVRAHMEADWQNFGARVQALQDKIDEQNVSSGSSDGAYAAAAMTSLTALDDKIANLGAVLPAELQRGLQANFQTMTGRLDQIRELSAHTVEALSAVVSSLPSGLHEALLQSVDNITSQIEAARSVSSHTNETILSLATALPSEVRRLLHDDLATMTSRIEAARVATAQTSESLHSFAAVLPGEISRQLHTGLTAMATQMETARALSARTSETVLSMAADLPGELSRALHADLATLATQVETTRTLSARTNDTVLSMATDLPGELRRQLREDLNGMATQIEVARDISADTHEALSALTAEMPGALRQHLQIDLETLANQIKDARAETVKSVSVIDSQLEDKLGRFGQAVVTQHQTTLDRAEFAVLQSRGDATALSQKINAVQATLDSIHIPTEFHLPPQFVQEMHDHWFRLTAQIQGSSETMESQLSGIGTTVAHNNQIMLEHAQSLAGSALEAIAALNEKVSKLQASVGTIQIPEFVKLSPAVTEQMEDHWYQMAAQIEASRSSLDTLLSRDIASKLSVFAEVLTSIRQAIDAQRTESLKPAAVTKDPLEAVQKQWNDQWYHMAGQIEATRSSLVDTIAEQIGKMESKLMGAAPDALSKTASDYATQRQIEQQTQILSELVATLSVLDSHMQQIKVEMHSAAR